MPEPVDRPRINTTTRAALIVALAFIAYLPAMRGGFLWDDDVHVTANFTLRSLNGLKLIWFHPGATPQYYPLTHTTFWVQYQIWGDNPLPYHVVNVLLHAGNALLVWLILSRLGIPGAWLAGAIFAVHPVHVESVAWITERKNVLAGFFYLLAAACWLKAFGEKVNWRWYAVGAVCFAAALLSKTVTASLPAAILLVLAWRQKRITRGQLAAIAPMLLLGACMGRVTSWMEFYHVGARGPEWDLSFFQRLLIAGRAVWFYAEKLVAPVKLSFIYPRWPVSVRDWEIWVYLIAATVVIGTLALSRKWLDGGGRVAALFFVGTLFPAMGFVNVYPMRYSFVADHFQYLASIGLIAAVSAMLVRVRWLPVFLPFILAALTWQRAGVFISEQVLWEDTLAKNPDCWIAHDSLGAIALEHGDLETAAGHYQMAVQINPDHMEGYIGLGDVLMTAGQPRQAIEKMHQAVSVRPDKPLGHFNLAMALAVAGEPEQAIAEYHAVLRADPNFFPAHLRLAEIYARTGQPQQAEQERQLALGLMREAFGYDARP